jgi:hypothetical protein
MKRCEHASKRKNKKEDPFSLIEKGNSLESSHNKWGSSDYYSRASSELLNEFQALNATIGIGNDEADNENSKKNRKDEQKKIAALYHDQSVEYLNKARASLIGALMFEREEDLKRWADTEPMVEAISRSSRSSQSSNKQANLETQVFDPLMTMLTDDQVKRRMETFRRLFVSSLVVSNDITTDIATKDAETSTKELELEHQLLKDIPEKKNDIITESKHIAEKKDETVDNNEVTELEQRLANLVPANNNLDEQFHSESTNTNDVKNETELSLEERLANLNSSIPQKMKSDNERLENIQSGLGDLGVYVPSQNKNNFLHEQEMTEDEQIQLIMDMAKDEVALDKESNDDDDDDNASNNETVEDIMKRSGIRFELPSEEDHSYSDGLLNIASDPAEEEDDFRASMKTLRDPNNDDIDSDSDEEDLQDLEDMKRALAKSQQMLLQANICLDELDEMTSLSCSQSQELTEDQNPMVIDKDDNEIDQHEEQESNDDKDSKLGLEVDENRQEGNISEEGNKKEIIEKIEKEDTIDIDKSSPDGAKDVKIEENVDSCEDIEGNNDNLSVSDKSSTDDAEKNSVLNEKADTSQDVDVSMDHKQVEDDTKNSITDGQADPNQVGDVRVIQKADTNDNKDKDQDTEQERIRKMGKESLLKAQAYLERLLRAWPDELVSE